MGEWSITKKGVYFLVETVSLHGAADAKNTHLSSARPHFSFRKETMVEPKLPLEQEGGSDTEDRPEKQVPGNPTPPGE